MVQASGQSTTETLIDPPPWSDLAGRACAQRDAGNFHEAARLFERASATAPSVTLRLRLSLRRAYCWVAVGELAGAVNLATGVAHQARSESLWPLLADALSIVAAEHMRANELAEAAELLAEATYALGRVDDGDATHEVINNVAATYSQAGFTAAALDLHRRALAIAGNDAERQFTLCNLAEANLRAAEEASDLEQRNVHLLEGLEAADAALAPDGPEEFMRTVTALCNRAQAHAWLGNHSQALSDATAAIDMCDDDRAMVQERLLARAAAAVADWHLNGDAAVLDVIAAIDVEVAVLGLGRDMALMHHTEIQALWTLGRHDDARVAMQRAIDRLHQRLHGESAARWQHMRLGVENHRIEAVSETDPLTGLPNRRYLNHWLPEVLEARAPVAVGVLDLDGFKQINDDYTYSHGDRMLQELAGLLEHVCRRGDAVVRLGGDEFVLILPATSAGDANLVVDRVRQMIAEHAWDGLPADLRLSCSIGLTVGSGAFDSTRVLTAATAAMQAAKRGGRNCVVLS